MAVKFQRSQDSDPKVELTPMIDVIFQLLIFFMISSSFLYPSLKIELPKADNKGQVHHDQQLILSITPTGDFYINNSPVETENLEATIGEELRKLEKKSVFFRADQTIPYKQVIEVMQSANAAGAQQFNFIYESEKNNRIN